MIDPENYHDYVIKDGKFIGEFDAMYMKFDDPWHQSEQPNKYSRMSGILHMHNLGVKSVLECGCGLGYYANWIHQVTGIVPKSVDISGTAVNRARLLFPHLDFEVADITTDLVRFRNYDCVLFAEIIWYVLPQLNPIFETLRNDFRGKYFIVNQVFYKGTQRYGTEYFNDLKSFISSVPFPLVASCEATMTKDTTIETSTAFLIS